MASYPKLKAATTVIPFADAVTRIAPFTISGPTNFTVDLTNAQDGYVAFVRVTANGVNTPTFASTIKGIGTGTWDNTNGVVNQLWFVYDGTEVNVAFTHPVPLSGGGGGGGGDTTPPSTTSVTVENAEPNKVLIAYGETLDSGSVPATSAYTVKVNGTTRTVSAVAITGANVKVTFGGAAVVSTDTITLDYVVPGTSPIQDAAGNDAAALTAVTVGNNVAPAATLDNLTLSTNDGYTNTSQVFTVTAGGSSWGNRGLDTKTLPLANDGWVEMEYNGTGNCFLGFMDAHALTGYSSMKVAIWFYADGTLKIQNNGGDTGTYAQGVLDPTPGTVSVGDKVRIKFTGTDATADKSTDGGTTWTALTLPQARLGFQRTGTLSIVSDINGTGALKNPKAYNVV
jgi:hypothetical protein